MADLTGLVGRCLPEAVDADVAFDTLHAMLSSAMQRAFADPTGERADDIEQAVTELVVRAFVKRP